MKKLFFISVAFLFFSLEIFSQGVRPDQFPTGIPARTDAIYHQEGAIPEKILFGDFADWLIDGAGTVDADSFLVYHSLLKDSITSVLSKDDSLYLVTDASDLAAIVAPTVGDLALNSGFDTLFIRSATDWKSFSGGSAQTLGLSNTDTLNISEVISPIDLRRYVNKKHIFNGETFPYNQTVINDFPNQPLKAAFGFTCMVEDTIIIIYRAGVTTESSDGIIVMFKSGDLGTTWTSIDTIYEESGFDCRDPYGGVSANGDIIVFFTRVVQPLVAGSWKTASYIRSTDGGLTWSAKTDLPFPSNATGEDYFAVYGKVEIIDGDTLLKPFYLQEPYYGVWAIWSADDGATWSADTIMIDTGGTITETDIVYLGNRQVLAVARHDGEFQHKQYFSDDNGATWTAQGKILTDTFNNISPVWLETFESEASIRYAALYYFDRSTDDTGMKVIYAKVSDFETFGVDAWQLETRRHLNNWDSGVGYPSAVHPFDNEFAVGWHSGSSDKVILFTNKSGTPESMIVRGENVGIKADPINTLDVNGGVAIGSTFAGILTAPAQGLLVAGSVGFGTSIFPGTVFAVKSTVTQLRLQYNDIGTQTDFWTNSSGSLAINPSNEKVAINFTTPISSEFQVHAPDNSLSFRLSTLGTGLSSGFGIDVNSTGTTTLGTISNAILKLKANNLTTLTLGTDQKVGIIEQTPEQELDILGSIKVDSFYYDSNNSAGSVGQTLTATAVGTEWATGSGDHGALSGLLDDDHTQYALLAGRTGGQILYGGDGENDDLQLVATSGLGTFADIRFRVGNNGANRAMTIANNGFVGIGTISIGTVLTVEGSGNTGYFESTTASNIFKFRSSTGQGATDGMDLFINSTNEAGLKTFSPFTVHTSGAGSAAVERFRIDTLGYVTIPNQVDINDTLTVNGTIDFNSTNSIELEVDNGGGDVNELNMDHSRTAFTAGVRYSGSIAVGISATTNNWAPTGSDAVSTIYLTLTGDQTITGFNFPNFGGLRVRIHNDDTADAVTFEHEGTGSTSVNRLHLPDDMDLVIGPGGGATFEYNGSLSRWNVISTTGEINSFAKMTFADSSRVVVLTGASTYDWVTNSGNDLFTHTDGSGAFVADGDSIIINCVCAVSIDVDFSYSGGNTSEYKVKILRNGSEDTETGSRRTMTTTAIGASGFHSIIRANQGEVLKIGIEEVAGTTDATFYSGSIIIMKL